MRMYFYFFLLCLSLFFISCNHLGNFIGGNDEDSSCVNPADTGGKNSELAILMREMKEHSLKLKAEISSGKVESLYPGKFNNIFTATPTDSAVKGQLFNALSQTYLNALMEIYHSPDSNLVFNYNRMINTCIGCHKNFCPGPIRILKKLSL